MAQELPPRTDVFEATRLMVELGFRAFPLKANAKVPFTPNGFKAANADLDRIRTWINNPGRLNVGLVWPVGVRIVFLWDLDGETWKSEMKALIARHGDLPPTLVDKTPSGGRHMVFEWNVSTYGPPPEGNHLFGFVVRWPEKGYIVGPGSSIDGIVYETNGLPIAQFPEAWALAALEHTGKALITVAGGGGGVQLPARVAEGGRYDAIRTLTAQLYNRGLGEDLVWPAVIELGTRFSVPLTEPELRDRFERTWKDIEKRLGEPRSTPEIVEARAEARLPSKFEDRVREDLPTGAFPDEPDAIAFAGLAGEMVGNLEPQTSASRVGLLTSILAIAGTVLATETGFYGRQPSSFMTCLVGDTARGRKGTAMNTAWDTMTVASAFGPQLGVRLNGIGSGEGIVSTTARRAEKEGFARILVQEGELGSVLTIGRREGTTLSYVLRNAFDRQPLMNITKAGAIGVEPEFYQLGLLAGITPDELRALTNSVDLVNGFANRILWVPVIGRDEDVAGRDPFLHDFITTSLAAAIDDAALNRHRRFELDDDALAELKAYYAVLATVPGVSGRLTIRFATIAARIALVHASLDQDSPTITLDYVQRAIALTEYCRSGVDWVFGAAVVGSADAQRMLRVLYAAGEPLSRSQLGDAVWRKTWNADRLDDALDVLRAAGLVQVEVRPTGGRPSQMISPTLSHAQHRRFSRAGLSSASRTRTRGHDDVAPDVVETPEITVEPSFELESTRYKGRDNTGEKEGENLVLARDKSEAPWRYRCHYYEDHRFQHHLVAGQWECPICRPETES